MDKNELQIKQDKNVVDDIVEEIELASRTKIVPKEELLQDLNGKDVVKTRMEMLLDKCLYNIKKN